MRRSAVPLQALVLEAEEKLEAQGAARRLSQAATMFYEVTIASIDQPKLLSRLSESLVCAWKFLDSLGILSCGGCLHVLPEIALSVYQCSLELRG